MSDPEATEFGVLDVKLEVKTEVVDEQQQQQVNSKQTIESTPVAQPKRYPYDITDEKFKVPFKHGWKRELVYRHQTPDTASKTKAEVYYITPGGKKLRTKNEIQLHITDGLDLTMFTFSKEKLNVGDAEIVRNAKPYTPQNQRKAPVPVDLGDIEHGLGIGKRIPKPKMPKGASPPPSNRVKLIEF